MVLKAENACHARGPQYFDFMLEGRGQFDGAGVALRSGQRQGRVEVTTEKTPWASPVGIGQRLQAGDQVGGCGGLSAIG